MKEQFRNGIDFASIDLKCEQCHRQHAMHEPNVVENRACSICHQEHLGPGRMTQVTNRDCLSCHNNASIMEASAKKGMQLPADAFHVRRAPRPAEQVVFEMPRPPRGYTQVRSSRLRVIIQNFNWFVKRRVIPMCCDSIINAISRTIFRRWRRIGNSTATIVTSPVVDGRFYQRVTFEANCQACHALLFDQHNPELHIPHGDVSLVRTFLRTLPAQYGDYARLKGKTQRERRAGLCCATDQTTARTVSIRGRIGAGSVFREGSLSAAAAGGLRDSC